MVLCDHGSWKFLHHTYVPILLVGLVSAMAALDGKQYNNLRSKIHSLSNKVNPRLTVSGFKVLNFLKNFQPRASLANFI